MSSDQDMSKHIPYGRETVKSIIGEGLHAGLRKGTDAPEADKLWKMISTSDKAWSDALEFLMWGLEEMDIVVSIEPRPVADQVCEVCDLGDGKFNDRGEPLGPVRFFEWPHHAHLACGREKGWSPR